MRSGIDGEPKLGNLMKTLTVQTPHPADFVWFVSGGLSRVYRNDGKPEARFIGFAFSPI
jgi:hypothetical protein